MTQRGFTLVELLVVLAILASLTTIAVRSLAGAQERAKFEATQRLLQDIDLALLGERIGAPRGLLADTCRLPISTPDRSDLCELWLLPTGMASSHVEKAADPEVLLAVGWAGPYLSLPPAASELLDGWGRQFEIVADANAWGVRSRGADGAAGGTGFDQDLVLQLRDDGRGVDRVHAELVGTVTVTGPLQSGSDLVSVVLFEADPVSGRVAVRRMDGAETPPAAPSSAGSVAYAFTRNGGALGADNRAVVGRRVVRAYVHAAADLGAPWQNTSDRSRAITVDLRAGAQQQDLTVP